jgi:hypothetical protein
MELLEGNIKMFNLNYYMEVIERNDISEAITIIEEIGEQKNIEALPFLIETLKNTSNHNLRNCIALALRDIGSEEAVEPILSMLIDPITVGNRGTLLYALVPFDCSAYIELIVDLMINGNWEVRHNSLQLIDSIKKDLSVDVLHRCIDKINKEVDELEDKLSIFSDSLDVLHDLKSDN